MVQFGRLNTEEKNGKSAGASSLICRAKE